MTTGSGPLLSASALFSFELIQFDLGCRLSGRRTHALRRASENSCTAPVDWQVNMRSPTLPPPGPNALSEALTRNIEALETRRRTEEASASRQDRIAQAITNFTGSMRFVYLHLVIYSGWIIVNSGLLPGLTPFDPSFVILASEASVEAIFLSTFVLISQNRMAERADKRADLDLHINLLAEHELTRLAKLVEAIANHLNLSNELPGDMDEVKRDVAPEAILDEIARHQDNE
ncbi:DUF1003 domain-containing protein [Sphingomonas sp. DT-51]|uniref:DUF1003 domain-containing protein n=1 Tax=Sphingomonas sp. DT-51 TaxID=3396165 RepID=UPI003F1DE297